MLAYLPMEKFITDYLLADRLTVFVSLDHDIHLHMASRGSDDEDAVN